MRLSQMSFLLVLTFLLVGNVPLYGKGTGAKPLHGEFHPIPGKRFKFEAPKGTAKAAEAKLLREAKIAHVLKSVENLHRETDHYLKLAGRENKEAAAEARRKLTALDAEIRRLVKEGKYQEAFDKLTKRESVEGRESRETVLKDIFDRYRKSKEGKEFRVEPLGSYYRFVPRSAPTPSNTGGSGSAPKGTPNHGLKHNPGNRPRAPKPVLTEAVVLKTLRDHLPEAAYKDIHAWYQEKLSDNAGAKSNLLLALHQIGEMARTATNDGQRKTIGELLGAISSMDPTMAQLAQVNQYLDMPGEMGNRLAIGYLRMAAFRKKLLMHYMKERGIQGGNFLEKWNSLTAIEKTELENLAGEKMLEFMMLPEGVRALVAGRYKMNKDGSTTKKPANQKAFLEWANAHGKEKDKKMEQFFENHKAELPKDVMKRYTELKGDLKKLFEENKALARGICNGDCFLGMITKQVCNAPQLALGA